MLPTKILIRSKTIKKSIFFSLVFIFSVSAASFGQESKSSTRICDQPYSYKFDEFDFSEFQEVKNRVDLFALQLKENEEFVGYIIGYEGLKIDNSVSPKGYEVLEYLEGTFKFRRYQKIIYVFGGYRQKPSIEFFIRPQKCSEEPEATPTLKIEDVIFNEEESFFPANVVVKDFGDLNKLLLRKVDPTYPPAAKAVGAKGKVLLLVLTNSDGKVIKTVAVAGHPLLRSASESAVKRWEFSRVIQKGKPINFGGKVVIDWDILWNQLAAPTINY
jgi:hypothetical protein